MDIKQKLFFIAGVDEGDEDYGIVTIKSNSLNEYSTACGRKGNKPFNENNIKLLPEEVTILIDKDTPLIICGMCAKMNQNTAEKFSNLIDKQGGSLRANNVRDGQIFFETE